MRVERALSDVRFKHLEPRSVSQSHYLKGKLKQKGLEAWIKWYSTCLVRERP
jgi:hypothetical protein